LAKTAGGRKNEDILVYLHNLAEIAEAEDIRVCTLAETAVERRSEDIHVYMRYLAEEADSEDI